MKALSAMNNVERAKLLFDLFPQEKTPFVDFEKKLIDHLVKNSQTIREKWEDGMFSFEFWVNQANGAGARITSSRSKMTKNSQILATELFDDMRALFSAHCLQQYTLSMVPKNKHFILAVKAIFT
jgi:hypothetical protein